MITKACFWIFDLIFWWWWDGNLISQLKTWALTRLWHDIILKRSQTIRATILHFWSLMLKTLDCSFVCLIWGLVTLIIVHVQMVDFEVGWESNFPVKNVSANKTLTWHHLKKKPDSPCNNFTILEFHAENYKLFICLLDLGFGDFGCLVCSNGGFCSGMGI